MIKKRSLVICLLCCVLSSCTDESPSAIAEKIPSLHLPPKTYPLKLNEGYNFNPWTGDSIQPLRNKKGEIVPSGQPLSFEGKVYRADGMPPPSQSRLEVKEKIPAYNNVHPIAANPPRVFIPDQPPVKIPLGKGDRSEALVNIAGDTIPSGIPLPIIRRVVPRKFPHPTKATPARYKDDANADIKFLNSEQGMDNPNVYTLLEDRKGRLWYGTYNNGLSMYDGHSFTHFTTEHGLPSNRIRSLMEDSKGNLWIGMEGDRNIAQYDGTAFTSFSLESGPFITQVMSIVERPNGDIWFGCWNKGLIKYDGQSFTFFTKEEGLSDNDVTTLMGDDAGRLWIGTWGGGVNIFDGRTFTHLTEENGLPVPIIRALLQDDDGNYWIGTAGRGLVKYEEEGEAVKYTYYTTKEGLSNNVVRAIEQGADGKLWIGTNGGGMNRFDGTSFTHYTTAHGLVGNQVFDLAQSSGGRLWAACFSNGISVVNGHGFTHLTERDGLSGGEFSSVMSDRKGHLWFATNNGGIRYDGKALTFFSKKNPLAGSKVRTLCQDKRGNLWAGLTFNVRNKDHYLGGLCQINEESVFHYTRENGLGGTSIRSITEDAAGHLWLGFKGSGLNRMELDSSGRVSRYIHFDPEAGFPAEKIFDLHTDQKGNIWLATWGLGICKYEPPRAGALGTFTFYTTKEGLPDNFIWSIHGDEQGNLWIGTNNNGLCIFDGQAFTTYTTVQGLSSNRAKSIITDKNGWQWIGTENGISLFQPLTDNQEDSLYLPRIVSFNKADGLKSLQIYFNGTYIDPQDRIWWGTAEGFSMLDLNTLHLSDKPPALSLNYLEVNEAFVDFQNLDPADAEVMAFRGVLPYYNLPIDPKFSFDRNHLTFHFAAIDWVAPHKIRYSHKIVGLNDKWSTPSPENIVDYRNIPPGKYTLKVRAAGQSMKWSEPIAYRFEILPPWWWTWWAKLLYLGLGLLFISGYMKWRTFQLKRRQKELEAEVKRATHEIEEEKEKAKASERAKQQFLANMSHEIRTPMNAIIGMTEILIRRIPKSDQLTYLNAIKESSSSLLVIINDILDLSKAEAGKVKLERIPFSLKEIVANVTTVMQFKAEEKGLQIHTNVPDEMPGQVLGDPTRLHQILLNLVGNAVKFTEKGSVTIQLEVEKGEDSDQVNAKLCVSDTGIGMDESRLGKIFESFEQANTDTSRKYGGTGLGLSISKTLVELQGGRIWAESKEGKGSQFYVVIPYLRAAREQTVAPQSKEPETADPATTLRGIRVLLAEDNAFNVIVAEEELEDAIEGVMVEVAENGAIAVEKIRSGAYDLILMDVQMPVMNGYEATQKIRGLENGKSNIPIIAMTANVLKEEVERCYEAGMDDFIGKPFDTEELLQKMSGLMRKQVGKKEP